MKAKFWHVLDTLFGTHVEVEGVGERVDQSHPVAPPPPFQARGLDAWQEHVFVWTTLDRGALRE